jgi:hypothetical protein
VRDWHRGSTRLLEHYREAMLTVLARNDAPTEQLVDSD